MVNENAPYHFTPIARDPDGDSLSFSISGKPNWAVFDSSTGTLSGTPNKAAIDTYNNIIISVTDGSNTVSLNSFYIEVKVNNKQIIFIHTDLLGSPIKEST